MKSRTSSRAIKTPKGIKRAAQTAESFHAPAGLYEDAAQFAVGLDIVPELFDTASPVSINSASGTAFILEKAFKGEIK